MKYSIVDQIVFGTYNHVLALFLLILLLLSEELVYKNVQSRSEIMSSFYLNELRFRLERLGSNIFKYVSSTQIKFSLVLGVKEIDFACCVTKQVHNLFSFSPL